MILRVASYSDVSDYKPCSVPAYKLDGDGCVLDSYRTFALVDDDFRFIFDAGDSLSFANSHLKRVQVDVDDFESVYGLYTYKISVDGFCVREFVNVELRYFNNYFCRLQEVIQ